jgi:hypothetical protein
MSARRDLAIAAAMLAVILSLLAFGQSSAAADVGVEKASRHAGRPGEEVRLTLACGFCFPPCEGPKGERHPKGFEHGPCMLGTKDDPPASFGVSLVARDRAEGLVACNVRGGPCPTPTAPPRRHGFRFLGEATPPPGGNDPEGGDPPRYLLSFAIPDLPPGEYSYVIWCDVCLDGRAGALIANPVARLWRLAVPAPPGP